MFIIESQYLAIIAILLAVFGWGFKKWWTAWDDKLRTAVKKIGKHNIEIAIIKANMEHIRNTGDETSKDVKRLLQINGTKRNTG